MRNFKTYLIVGLVLIALFVTAFVFFTVRVVREEPEPVKKSNVELIDPAPDRSAGMVGNDRDEHGCIASAGYTWSELLQECIRPFEKGIKLLSVEENDAVFAAYLIFNENESQVEVFLPREETHPILTKDAISIVESVWVSSLPDTPVVKQVDGKWAILFNDKVAFAEE